MSEWATYPKGTAEDHWLDLEYGRSQDGPPSYRASVKWDGCVHLYSYMNGADPATDSAAEMEQNTEYFHICDVEVFIGELQALVAKAREHFGEWPR